MPKHLSLLFISIFSFAYLSAQTTDLSVITEAQDLAGSPISQVSIYEEFQYIVTIVNSGGDVSNSSVSVQLDTDVVINSFVSQNNIGGASNVTNMTLSAGNTLTGEIADIPNSSSVEILINVNAPTELGGIALSSVVSPPDGTTDINDSNNTSIISIDVINVNIDFTVTHSQISPSPGNAIINWGDMVTYRFTITNNSEIDFPIDSFTGNLSLISNVDFGEPNVRLISIACLSGTNGTECIDTSSIVSSITSITSTQSVFSYNESHEFTAGGSLNFEVIYEYLDPNCGSEIQPIDVESFIEITLDHENISDNSSNLVPTQLIEGELCPVVDICINTEQINPTPGTALDYNQTITFETVVCNNGPIDARIRFFLQNLSIPPAWSVTSLNCISPTGSIVCDYITLTIDGQIWKSEDFTMPANTTITVVSEFEFIEPSCSTNQTGVEANIRSVINILDINIVDTVPENNLDSDIIILPSAEPCPSADLSVTKTQIDPIDNPVPWGEVTYEITVLNNSEFDAVIDLRDYMPNNQNDFVTAILRSVSCVDTTGDASCFDIQHTNIDVLLDGEPQDDEEDVFWEILPEDNWLLPANSSVVFEVTIEWFPECSDEAITSINGVEVNYVNGIVETNPGNNRAFATTQFAPCIDLIVQTFPEFTQTGVNQSFDWIIDISNSVTSSEAIDVVFENTLNDVFSVLGTPTCTIVTGNVTCVTNFSTSGNIISGIIPNMSAGSTVQIRIPVLAPSFGGAFNNIAEAIVSSANNQELTPETNVSISNILVIAPVVAKVFEPQSILTNEESLLTFTIINLATNPEQNNIMFLDNLPEGIALAGLPFWENQNGSTGDFTGNIGDTSIGISNLTIPEDITSCTFSVLVTSNVAGEYTNNFSNFSEINNIDASQANATLSVIQDPNAPIIDCTTIPQGISPNNDGKNDEFIIPCIEDYPNNTMKIYNRYGTLVYQKKNYENDWNGRSNTGLLNHSELLPIGTYFFIFEINETEKPLNGFIYLNY